MSSDPPLPPEQPQLALPPDDETPANVPASKPESAGKFTRAPARWSSLIVGFLILILLLVFIMQNTASTTVNFFAWQASLPVGVAVLLSAVGGGLLTVAAGTARIVQLRRAAKKNLKAGL